MGYLALVAVIPLARAVSMGGLLWLVAGGACLHRRRCHLQLGTARPTSRRFGHHEIWHILVLIGSACHFVFMLYHVA